MKIFKSTIEKGDFCLSINDFEIEENKIHIILGENGSGKSTFCKSLALGKIHSGFNNITILNQKLYVYNQKVNSLVTKVIKWNDSNITVDDFLAKYDLLSKKNTNVKKLSGGEFRKLSLGLILLTKTQLLILDEPFVGIDLKSQKDILKILEQEKLVRTIFLITHKLGVCKKIGDNFIFMKGGKIISISHKNDFFESDNVYIKNFLEIEGFED